MHVWPLDKNQSGVALQLLLQVGVEGPVLTDAENNAYIFRVTEAKETHVPSTPEEMAEIRGAIVRDLQRVAYFEQLKNQGKDLQASAATVGLKPAAAAKNLTVALTPKFARTTVGRSPKTGHLEYVTPPIDPKADPKAVPNDGRLGVIPEFTAAAFDLAMQLGRPTQGAVSRPSWVPSAGAPTPTPAATVSIDSTLTVYVLALDLYDPVPVNALTDERAKRAAELLGAQRGAYLQEWLKLGQTAMRNNFKPDGIELDKE
jgi:hypothetical protein